MYRQIRVDDRDADYQRILWAPVSGGSAVEFVLRTVTYGTACAPFLALRVLQQLVADEGSSFPRAVSVLRDHIYVDDVLFGHDDLDQLTMIRDELTGLLRRGGFSLRKWASNSPLLLRDIDEADHGLACTKALATDEQVKVLGVGWAPAIDTFRISVSLSDRMPVTKRGILSVIARLFDPVGWLTPTTVAAKIIMQGLWREKLAWDDPVSAALLNRWTTLYASFHALRELRIPRWFGLGATVRVAELHGFADASNVAYAAVVYLRIVAEAGTVSVSLVAGKSRVAPLKSLSVPRLELCGAVLLARLLEFARRSLGSHIASVYAWLDSTVALTWIARPPSRWTMFVANRVSDVQTRLPDARWRHVPTLDNPADCASRGLRGDELVQRSLWWHGPEWLRRSADQWPPPRVQVSADDPVPEERRVAAPAIIAAAPKPWDLDQRYSSWPKLLRVTAYVLRFVHRCRPRPAVAAAPLRIGLALSPDECQAAKLIWLKRIQAELFSAELRALASHGRVSGRSAILSLNPFVDDDGLLRVGGRLRRAPVPFSTRHPVLLASHPLVKLIIVQQRVKSLHAGLQLTLSSLRREFWIIRARSVVRTVLHRCVVCARERAAAPSQLMGDLPAVRVTPPSRAFVHCGVDYAGPVYVRNPASRGQASRKAYIALFICLATRAVHLELVSDCSTPAFRGAFARFCARRGLPQAMYSDNGTTFVGADRELATSYRAALRDADFQNATALDRVEWHFIPPSAPHFGGLWEAGVKSVKHHVRRVLRGHPLTFEEFATLLCAVEACLNSRSLAPLTDSVDDVDPLTPGHFLIGSALTSPPDPSVLHLQENRLSRWQLVRQLTESFWRRWSAEYVNTLQQRSKWRRKESDIQLGQFVLIRHHTLPPGKWEMGRVTACHPGTDGLTRVVTVRTATAELKRPIGKLCVLPVETGPTSP